MNDVYTHLFLNHSERKFIKFNKNYIPKSSPQKKPLNILIQGPEDYSYLAIFSSILRSLRGDFTLSIEWIQVLTASQRGGRYGFLKKNRFYNRKWTKLYTSNGGCFGFSNAFYSDNYQEPLLADADKLIQSINSKADILNLHYQNIWIGDLIYDTYLRFKPAATVDLSDPLLKNIIITAVHILYEAKVLVDKKDFDCLFTTYSSYIHHGLMIRVFQEKEIPVFAFNQLYQTAELLSKTHLDITKDYLRYKFKFDLLDELEKQKARKLSEDSLGQRFKGSIDMATIYMKNSAYHSNPNQEKYFSDNNKKRVVVFLHCFFDSPHIFRGMLHADFLEWIRDTLRILSETEMDVYVKPHPNGVSGNEEIVEVLKNEFPKIKFLSKSISNLQLINEGFNLAITVYGTLGHEFPYFGIPVLNAGDNPHINYNFSVHAQSKEEYEQLLRNIDLIKKIDENSKKEILEFYYMHNLYPYPGGFSPEAAQLINKEFRGIRTSRDLAAYTEKSEDDHYRSNLDQVLYQSFKEVACKIL